VIFEFAFFALATTSMGVSKYGLCYEGKTVSFVLSFNQSHARSEEKKISTTHICSPNILPPLLPSMVVRHNHDANVPPANARLSSEAQSELKREESDDNARNKANLANAFAEEKDCCKRLIELQDRKNELLFKEANVPLEQQEPSPDSDDFDVEEEVGSTEGNSQTNDDNTTKTTRKFNALEKRLDLLEEDVMDLQINNDVVLAYAAAVPFVLTFAMYCLRHFASSMSRD